MKSLIHTIEKPEKNIYIYGLIDPRDNQIKYIGLATRGFNRMKQHWNSGVSKLKKPTKIKSWIKTLKKENMIFQPIYLEYFETDGQHLDEAEIFWIAYFKMIGAELLNHDGGGRTEYLKYNSQETRIKQSIALQKPKSKEHAKNIKAGQTKAFGLKIEDSNGNTFNSLREAADFYKTSTSNIQKAVYKDMNSFRGITFERIGGGRKPIGEIKSHRWIKKGRTPIENKIIDSNGTTHLNAKECAKNLGIQHRQVFRLLSGECKTTKAGISLKYFEAT